MALSMDPRKLEVFLAVADRGNLTRAAEAFAYTQSGVTQMMNSLEEELGFKLLLRSNKGVHLTREAQRLLPYMRDVKNAQERLFQECALLRGAEEGNICVGSFSSISVHWLPRIIRRFGERYPGIEVEVLEGTPPELTAWLSEGRVDICFVSIHPNDPFESEVLLQDPLLAIVPKGHPLAARASIPPALLAAEPFIVYRSYSGGDEDIDPIFGTVEQPWNFRYASNFDQNIISMVEQGLGVSIMAELILRESGNKVEARPLDPPRWRNLGVILRSFKEASPALKRFIACVKEVIAEF